MNMWLEMCLLLRSRTSFLPGRIWVHVSYLDEQLWWEEDDEERKEGGRDLRFISYFSS